MRHRGIIFMLAAAAISLVPTMALADTGGSVFGGLTTAQTYGQGKATIGIHAGLADANAFGGWFGFGMSKYTDCRVKLGIYDAGRSTRLALGGDFKWQFWSMAPGSRYPLDMAVGGFIEYDNFPGGSVLQLGSHLIGSYPIELYKSGVLSPYGRLSVRLHRTSYSGIADSNSDIKFGLNGGAAWEVTNAMKMYGEFQFDGNDGVFFGIEFAIM
jgi:hypothetical protein